MSRAAVARGKPDTVLLSWGFDRTRVPGWSLPRRGDSACGHSTRATLVNPVFAPASRQPRPPRNVARRSVAGGKSCAVRSVPSRFMIGPWSRTLDAQGARGAACSLLRVYATLNARCTGPLCLRAASHVHSAALRVRCRRRVTVHVLTHSTKHRRDRQMPRPPRHRVRARTIELGLPGPMVSPFDRRSASPR